MKIVAAGGRYFTSRFWFQLLPATSVPCQRQLQKAQSKCALPSVSQVAKRNCFVFHGLKMTRYQLLSPCRANQMQQEVFGIAMLALRAAQ